VDPSPATLDVLPEIAAAVSGQVPVLLDSGVRTGADVFLALALGASAVVIGRLAAYGLAAAGERGVRRTIELLTQELHILMTLSGVPDIQSLTPGLVARRLPPLPGVARQNRRFLSRAVAWAANQGVARRPGDVPAGR
jgi:4-hydroxymandelate oxidase